MVCDTMVARNQTVAQRKQQVKTAAAIIDKLIAQRKVGVVVGPQGAVMFTGISDSDRVGMTDGCILNALTARGTAATRLAIQRAEMTAGRAIDRKAVAAGVHSHDGKTWSTH